ncbi:MAG: hypothetical protein ACYC2U_02505 [Candidatus Amoebophilus sp.]
MGASCEEDPYKFLYGRWKFYKHTPIYTMIGRLNQEESDKMINYLIGKEIVLGKNYLIIDGIKYKHPSYKIREEDSDNYFSTFWRIPNKQVLGIKDDTDKVKILNLNLNNKLNNQDKKYESMDWRNRYLHLGFDEIVYYEGKLLICYDTYFFHLEKVK